MAAVGSGLAVRVFFRDEAVFAITLEDIAAADRVLTF